MKILIVKTSSLGDILHAFPVLNYLHRKFPTALIDWVAEEAGADLLEAHPYVNEVYRVDTKKWRRGAGLIEFFAFVKKLRKVRYDVVFDLQGNVKSGLITAFAKSYDKVGFARQSVPEWPNLLFTNYKFNPPKGKNIREDYFSLVQSFFQDRQGYFDEPIRLTTTETEERIIHDILKHPKISHRKLVLVCPGSAWANKRLNTAALKDYLLTQDKDCGFLFLWGNDGERLEAEELSEFFGMRSIVVNKLPLPALQSLMYQVDLVISMDSLPLHLAGTTSTPTYSFFGASLATKYRPIGCQHQSSQGECPYDEVFEKRCAKLRTCSTGACIR